MSKGYVYILSNESMPGLVKIGRTSRSVDGRAHELYSTGVPTPFKVEEEVCTPDCAELERWVHEALESCRLSSSREFFRCKVSDAQGVLWNFHHEQIVELLGDYMPDKGIYEPDIVVCEGHIQWIAGELGRHPFEVASALGEITAEEAEVILRRWDEKVAERREKHALRLV